MYQWNFVKDLRARMRRKDALAPGIFPMERLADVRTVRQFDDTFTAPHFGFAGATDYYHRASAMRVVDRIRLPALVIAAEDDPFIPAAIFDAPEVLGNPWITRIVTRHGGHCGFIADRRSARSDGYWAEETIMAFLRGQL